MAKPILLEPKAFQKSLQVWFQKMHRKLPWREESSLYRTVVSEFMLQQTQVATVLPYFKRWLTVFPNFAVLASASEDQVIKQWEGLGYYSRARRLHQLAKQVVQWEPISTQVEDWQKLPGVGAYTAAAITSIAFGTPVAAVDGNVIRILSRLTASELTFKNSSAAVKALTPLAQELLDVEKPGAHNQAMMELGATVCFRQKPLCIVCPVLKFCQAGRQGKAECFPKLAPKKIVRRNIDRLWVENDSCLLLEYIPEGSKRLARHYELPRAEVLFKESIQTLKLIGKRSRGISNERISESIYLHPPEPNLLKVVAKENDLHWVKWEDLPDVTLSGPHRKWIAEFSYAHRK